MQIITKITQQTSNTKNKKECSFFKKEHSNKIPIQLKEENQIRTSEKLASA
jgi:hypothetical protein